MTAPRPANYPDEAHQDILERALDAIDLAQQQGVTVDVAMALISMLADLADTLGAAIPAAESTHSALQQADTAEAAARTSGDATLTANLAAEITRATTTEAGLRTDLTTETTRAKAAEKANADAITALTARVAALEVRSLRGTTGTAPLASLLASGTQTVNVTFVTPMADTNYTALIALDANATVQLGSVSPVYPVTNKTKTGCTVTVRNTGLSLVSNVVVQVAALSLS